MHTRSRIQPIDIINECTTQYEIPKKSRLFKRLFERQFVGNQSRNLCIEKVVSAEFDPNSVCLAKMVCNFIEENDKQSSGKNKCNCFNGSFSDSDSDSDDDDDDDDESGNFSGDVCEILKSLVPCADVGERNLLANISKIVEKNKIAESKLENCGMIVRDGLVDLGYDAAICKSTWEKSTSYPAGEYEYVDVIVEGVRLIVDIDFRSEFVIARSTNYYKAVLQILPAIFVGKSDRLLKMITLVSEAAKQSLKKKGMPFPPWRKADYIQSKWLSAYTRITPTQVQTSPLGSADIKTHVPDTKQAFMSTKVLKNSGTLIETAEDDCVFTLSYSSDEEDNVIVHKAKSPEDKGPKSSQLGVKVVTGFVPIINGYKP